MTCLDAWQATLLGLPYCQATQSTLYKWLVLMQNWQATRTFTSAVPSGHPEHWDGPDLGSHLIRVIRVIRVVNFIILCIFLTWHTLTYIHSYVLFMVSISIHTHVCTHRYTYVYTLTYANTHSHTQCTHIRICTLVAWWKNLFACCCK